MSTALYRRYRPDRFEDVIGQDHVTVPLRTALSKNRVNHAYLFSGPRGCGKTTSARILARCLNCAQGPTPTPCGECDSCRDLATGGPGSLDVLEIDAASHGGVEDARGLRERATFAPVRDRFKILIIDEAHMVTAAGFNALLKIVEEPPEHLKFIFATTEPDKVIGTIRSRTHHYPFRLVPPEPLIAYLEKLCAEEDVRVEPGVLPLVVRAGTGSVRDTLSVLDQLIGGAEQGQVSYDLAVSLLGFTPEALLDDVVDAIAADDSPTVFRVADRVVQSGQDPRRFVEDLLERFRDLVIARALPDEAGAILHGMPEDQVQRLAVQASQLSRAELSRLADVTNLALTGMVGATSPRLHLELLMARLMLPATDETHRGLAARLEALERRVVGGAVPTTDDGADSSAPAPADGRADGGAGLSGAALARAAMRRPDADGTPQASAPASPEGDRAPREPEPSAPTPATPEAAVGAEAPSASQPPAAHPTAPAPTTGEAPQGAAQRPTRPAAPRLPAGQPAPSLSAAPRPDGPSSPADAPSQASDRQTPATSTPAPAAPAAGATVPVASGPSQVEKVRRAWPDILAALEDASRLVWMLVKDNATVAGFDGDLLTVAFTQDGPRQSLLSRGGEQVLAEAVHRALGIRPELDLILGGDSPQGSERPAGPHRGAPQGRGTSDHAPQGRPTTDAPHADAPRGTASEASSPAPAPTQDPASAPAPRAADGDSAARPRSAAPSAPQRSATAVRPTAPSGPQGHGIATSWDDVPAPPPAAPGQGSTGPGTRPTAPPRPGAHPGPGTAATGVPPRTPGRPTPAETTPRPAPPSDGWGSPDEEPPAWDDAPPPAEDPWADLPEFDPDAEMEDSPGPEGWTPGPGDRDDTVRGAGGSGSDAAQGWDGDVPTPQDWGAPHPRTTPRTDAPDTGQEAAEAVGTPPAEASAAGSGDAAPAPSQAGPAASPGTEDAARAYDPGPLVREEELSIPVFAKPEAELRAEFAARFGGTRPSGFDTGSPARDDGTASASARAAQHGDPPRVGQDAAEAEAEQAADTEGDPQPAASAPHRPVAPGPARPTTDDTPDPGVPDEELSTPVTEQQDVSRRNGDTPDPAVASGGGPRGSGHPDSMFGALMERLEAGGPLDPPVNAGDASGSTHGGPSSGSVPPAGEATASTGATERPGRPSPATLGGRGGQTPPPADAPLALDPRAAAIRAAREAARGGGPRPSADTPPAPGTASGGSVDWRDEVASDDDVALEDSGLVGRPVVERLLGARLIEERPVEGGL